MRDIVKTAILLLLKEIESWDDKIRILDEIKEDLKIEWDYEIQKGQE